MVSGKEKVLVKPQLSFHHHVTTTTTSLTSSTPPAIASTTTPPPVTSATARTANKQAIELPALMGPCSRERGMPANLISEKWRASRPGNCTRGGFSADAVGLWHSFTAVLAASCWPPCLLLPHPAPSELPLPTSPTPTCHRSLFTSLK